MIDEHTKTLLLTQKSEISEESAKHRAFPKWAPSFSKLKSETPTNRKTSAGSLSPVATTRKMKAQDGSPKNRSKESSEGVHEFIKHVSDIIEKKNPFKETAVCSWPRENAKTGDAPVIDSVQFHGVSRKSQERKSPETLKLETNCAIDEEEINKNVMRKLKYREKLNSVPLLRKDSVSARGKIKVSRSSSKKREQKDKKCEKETSSHSMKVESKTIKKATAGKESQDVKLTMKPPLSREKVTAAPPQGQIKRRRPSEIPLRKNRTDSTSKPKPLSLMLGKPLKEVQKAAPVDLHTEKPEPCPELQMTINVDLSSEKISIIGEEMYPSGRLLNEEIGDIKLERWYKSSNISHISKLPSADLPEKPSTGKKTRGIDLEKVKTSSFTALRTNSTVLNRLESLHKKNIRSKEISTSGKTSPQKTLTSKASFSSLKGKSSKKSLLARTSSKGNKPGLKKKIKNLPQSVSQKPKKEINRNFESCRAESKERKIDIPVVRGIKIGNVTSEKTNKEKRSDSQVHIANLPRVSSSQRKTVTLRDKEEVEMEIAKQAVAVPESEVQKHDRPKSVRSSLLNEEANEQGMMINYNRESKLEVTLHLEAVKEIPKTPPPTPNTAITDSSFRKMKIAEQEEEEEEEEDGWSSKTVIFDDKYNYDSCTWSTVEQEIDEEFVTDNTETESKEDADSTDVKYLSLVVKGKSLRYRQDEPPEKPEGPDSPTVKKRLKIDLNRHGATSQIVEDNEENAPTFSGSNVKKLKEEANPVKTSSTDSERGESKEGKSRSRKVASDVFTSEGADEPGPLELQKPLRSCTSLKRKSQLRSGGHPKGGRKKNLRSDAGDRPSPSGSILFNSDISVQNKTKTDTKLRSGLTKSSKREEKLDVFEDAATIKLKRRNSEPNSFRGYIWKCIDSVNPKDHKASVSSLTSSLRHLNTDEIDDFIFWEAVPQKMTSCWEMSLYHFKRPWSVLSCSVFRDNRKSSTPGLILENLRNGGSLTRRCTINQSERIACRKENPFDVEPSIAQKNIDIRNWLAALNFPTVPSTSTDVFTEGNFSTQGAIDGQNLSKAQVSSKRRKVLPNIKFSDETSKKKSEEKEKHRKSTKWCDEEGLTQLVRRKSGGFVTREQFLNSEYPTHRPNVTVNFCVYSKSAEESLLVEASDRNACCEPRKYKSVEIAAQPEVSISATIINSGAVVGDQLIEKGKPKEKPLQETAVQEGENLGKILKQEGTYTHSDINIWKYLFLITIFIVTAHYCYINNYMCRN